MKNRNAIFATIPLVLACFALVPQARAVCHDGCLSGGNTVLGTDALLSYTSDALENTAIGSLALRYNIASDNTATGFKALYNNFNGGANTAAGSIALYFNIDGAFNTANGFAALYHNTASNNTATGARALESNTTGTYNAATGATALFKNQTGFDNTANGAAALYSNTTGSNNTATGVNALYNNNGFRNTATGSSALSANTSGNGNTASGFQALYKNQSGYYNTATGQSALIFNTIGNTNTATGVAALNYNQQGNNNTATGYQALYLNTAGLNNTAEGVNALLHSTGSGNIGLGYNAGSNLTTGSGNVCIGAGVPGVAGESNTTRIKNVYSSVASGRVVYVNSDNKIGTLSSSRRYKEEIKPMDKASETLFGLKPVTFRYKKEVDPARGLSFGLIAEEVAQISPDLITRDEQGQPQTVRYEAVNAMLLNEFLKEHRKVEQLEKQIEKLTAGLQKVSDQLEQSKSAPQMVLNDQ